MSKASNDEVDLLELFRRIGRTVSKWFRAIGNGFLISIFFLLRNIVPLTVSLLIGVGVSYILKWSSKPLYKSEIILRSNTVSSSEMISYFNKLGLLLEEENYDAVSDLMSIPRAKVITLKDLKALWMVDQNNDKIPDYIDYKYRSAANDTINERIDDRFAIVVSVADPSDLPLIRDGFLAFVKKDEILKIQNDFRLRKTDELLERLNYDIEQLDSLQEIKYYEETKNLKPQEGGQIVFLQEQKTQLVYEDIYNLYSRKQILDEEKDVFPEIITVISDFFQPLKRFNGGFFYGKVIIPIFFGLMLIFLIINRNRKKLKELYKRY
jgi:hypothetical protein